jgi:uncharacterized protein (DUF2147 family)
MRRYLTIFAAAFSLTGAAAAAGPTGEWLVANGDAKIRIDDCDGALWGIIAWEKDPGQVDSQNPDRAERNRPTLGLHVLIAMRPTKPNLWEGDVYNAENGKTYSSRMIMTAPDVLRIEGCVLGGIICGGENWTRVAEPPPPAAAAAPRAAPGQRAARAAPVLPRSACSDIANAAGAAHKGGLK